MYLKKKKKNQQEQKGIYIHIMSGWEPLEFRRQLFYYVQDSL